MDGVRQVGSAITEVIAVLGTMSGIGFVLLSAFLAIWSFTSSARAAAVCTGVLLCVLSTTTGLFYLFGWELGIVEAMGISTRILLVLLINCK